jgi:hypothetical protein
MIALLPVADPSPQPVPTGDGGKDHVLIPLYGTQFAGEK